MEHVLTHHQMQRSDVQLPQREPDCPSARYTPPNATATATATAVIWIHRPIEPPIPPGGAVSVSRSASPLANGPTVRNTPATTAIADVHRHRPK